MSNNCSGETVLSKRVVKCFSGIVSLGDGRKIEQVLIVCTKFSKEYYCDYITLGEGKVAIIVRVFWFQMCSS